jgi:hypothetical protein
METVTLATFEEFESKATVILEDHKEKFGDTKAKTVLFRGQSMASWELKTTLERYSTEQYSMVDYWKVMRSVKPAVESYTEKTWGFSDKYINEDPFRFSPQGYNFMLYLRHCGFPSPLLDWTRSFYVAAFFAFQSAQADEEPNVAIYSFEEYYGGAKIGSPNEATIVGCGPYVTTHKRHFSQQCEYTYCKKRLPDNKYVYCSHEEAFQRNDNEQDVLNKFTIPKTERAKVLEKLHMMNITAYSLFGSEESLLATLAYEEIGK